MTEQLPEAQAALLASMLEMTEFKDGRSSSAGGLSSPLSWTDGLLLIHSCPAPLDEHLLRLLGQSPVRRTFFVSRPRARGRCLIGGAVRLSRAIAFVSQEIANPLRRNCRNQASALQLASRSKTTSYLY